MAASNGESKHFVLVHGACLGAWIWFKLKPLLEAAGHRVTALDLAASGINMKKIQDVHSMFEYSEPLLEFMASLAPSEKVVLVGHSLGGLSLALAMDKFPEKVSVAVFVTAFLPDTIHQPSYVLDQFFQRIPGDIWLDSQFASYGSIEEPLITLTVGPKFLSSNVFQLSPVEVFELAKTLVRPGSLFCEDLSKAKKFSNDTYGTVPRVYVVCKEDKLIPEEFQRWLIKNNGSVSQVIEIYGADHMPMFSKPQELSKSLVKTANKYA